MIKEANKLMELGKDLKGKKADPLEAYRLPFISGWNWVEDADGKNVCEAYDIAVAKSLVEMLNSKYKK